MDDDSDPLTLTDSTLSDCNYYIDSISARSEQGGLRIMLLLIHFRIAGAI